MRSTPPAGKGVNTAEYTFFDVVSVSFFSFVSTFVYALSNTLLPSEAKKYDGDNLAWTLGVVFTLAALTDVVGLAVGALSDRTSPTARFGRRLPYIAGGLALGLCGFARFLTASSMFSLVGGFLTALTGLTAATTISHSLITEVLPTAESARASTAISVFGLLGSTLGLATVALEMVSPTAAVAIAMLCAVASVALQARAVSAAIARYQTQLQQSPAVTASSETATPSPMPPEVTLGVLGFTPSKHVDFCYCLAMRMFANAGLSALSFLQLYLGDCVHIADADLPRTTGTLALVTQGASLLFAYPASRMGDRFGKKWPMAAGLLLVSIALPLLPTVSAWKAAFPIALAFGIGCGLFFSLEIGTVYETMPSKRNGARHLGESLISCTVGSLAGQQLCGSLLQRHKAIGNANGGYYTRSGYAVIFVVSALLNMVAMAFCLMLDPKRSRAARKALDIDNGLMLVQSPPLMLNLEPHESASLSETVSSTSGETPAAAAAAAASSTAAAASPEPASSTSPLLLPAMSPRPVAQLAMTLPASLSATSASFKLPTSPPQRGSPPKLIRNSSMATINRLSLSSSSLRRQLSGPIHIKLPRAIAVIDSLDDPTTPPTSPIPQRRPARPVILNPTS